MLWATHPRQPFDDRGITLLGKIDKSYHNVFEADMNGKKVVVKLFDVYERFNRESCSLIGLKNICKTPEFIDSFQYSSKIRAMSKKMAVVMSFIPGVKVRDIAPRSMVDGVVSATKEFEKMHRAGYVHSDAALRNVIYNGTDSTLIDFEYTAKEGEKFNWEKNSLSVSIIPPESREIGMIYRTQDIDVFALGFSFQQSMRKRLNYIILNNPPRTAGPVIALLKHNGELKERLGQPQERPQTMIELREMVETYYHPIQRLEEAYEHSA